jgi:LysR family transcriptional regulator for bpeEF and oprC
MDQLAAMRAFVRVVEAGTFTRAADLLRTPKPTVTKLIQSLEAHIHTQLLNRTTRRVTVTPDGAAYYERVVRLLADIDELDSGMNMSQASLKGRIRIDVSAALALLIILPALSEFHARYPEIRFITCAAPAYLGRHGEPRHPSELEKGHYVVSYFSTRTGKSFPLSFHSRGEAIELAGRYIVSVNDGNAYLEAALVGMGVAQIPAFMAERHLARGALRPVLTDWTTEPLPLHVVYPPNRHLSNKLRVFVDWIADLFATHDLIRRRSTRAS